MHLSSIEEKDLVEIVSYHEAGHAIMAIWHGRRIREIAVTSCWTGHVANDGWRCTADGASAISSECQLHRLMAIIAEVKILLAAPAAECEFRKLPVTGRGSPSFTDHDVIYEVLGMPAVRELFDQHVPSGLDGLMTEVQAWIAQAEAEVWDRIRLVAEALMCRRRMEWDEIMDLLSKGHKCQLKLF